MTESAGTYESPGGKSLALHQFGPAGRPKVAVLYTRRRTRSSTRWCDRPSSTEPPEQSWPAAGESWQLWPSRSLTERSFKSMHLSTPSDSRLSTRRCLGPDGVMAMTGGRDSWLRLAEKYLFNPGSVACRAAVTATSGSMMSRRSPRNVIVVIKPPGRFAPHCVSLPIGRAYRSMVTTQLSSGVSLRVFTEREGEGS